VALERMGGEPTAGPRPAELGTLRCRV